MIFDHYLAYVNRILKHWLFDRHGLLVMMTVIVQLLVIDSFMDGYQSHCLELVQMTSDYRDDCVRDAIQYRSIWYLFTAISGVVISIGWLAMAIYEGSIIISGSLDEWTTTEDGLVYVLTNKSMPGLVKIGYSHKDKLENRIRSLSSKTGVPIPFDLEGYIYAEDPKALESYIHSFLDQKGLRFNNKREFYQVAPKVALNLLPELRRSFYLGLPVEYMHKQYSTNKCLLWFMMIVFGLSGMLLSLLSYDDGFKVLGFVLLLLMPLIYFLYRAMNRNSIYVCKKNLATKSNFR